MEDINYKERDREAILTYLKRFDGGVEVKNVMAESGADRLRVYPLLYELQIEGLVTVTRENDMGTPLEIRLR